jgi:hypothetical protein
METLNFNLDVESYKENEIEALFNIKKPYNATDIKQSKTILLNQLVNNKSLDIEKQGEIHFFIDSIANRLINMQPINMQPINMQPINMQNKNQIYEQGFNLLIENNNSLSGKNAKVNEGRLADGSGMVPPGYLNPINVRTITQTVNIDTRFRPNYYGTKSTQFSMTLPDIQKNVVKIRISSIEIPTTYHAISRSSGNSTCLIMDLNTKTNCWVVTLPDGNYEQSWANQSTAAFIETAMNNALQTAVPATIDPDSGLIASTNTNSIGNLNPLKDICFTLDRVSGRSIFAIPATTQTSIFSKGFIVRFNVDNTGSLSMETNIQMRLGWQLGFRSAQYVCGNKTTPSVGACVSEGICLICGPRYGLISIEDYQKNTSPSFIIAYANSILQNNVITRINLASVQADVGVYQVSNDPGLTSQACRTREYFGAVDIQKLFISLYDEFGRVIDLNNMDWSFTLDFEKLYD